MPQQLIEALSGYSCCRPATQICVPKAHLAGAWTANHVNWLPDLARDEENRYRSKNAWKRFWAATAKQKSPFTLVLSPKR